MKLPWWAVLVALLVGLALPRPWDADASAIADSLTVTRDSLTATRTWADSVFGGLQLRVQDTDRGAAAVSDSLHRLRLARRPATPPPPPVTGPDTAVALAWYIERTDSLGLWLTQCGAEADSARASARAYRRAFTDCAYVVDSLNGRVQWAEGRLNQSIVKVIDLDRLAERYGLGITAGAVGVWPRSAMPCVGPGVVGGIRRSLLRVPVLGAELRAGVGYGAALCLGEIRHGPSAALGFKVGF